MSKNINLLYVEHSKVIGGSNVSLKELAIDALQRGYSCTVLCANDSIADVYRRVGATTYVSTLAPFSHNTSYYYRFTLLDGLRMVRALCNTCVSFIKIHRIVKSVNPDIVHLNSSTLILYTLYFRLLGIANVIHVRENIVHGYFGIRRALIRWMANQFASFVIYISECEYELLATIPNKSFVVYNYVHEETFKKESEAAEPVDVDTKIVFTLITLGGLFSLKGGKKILDSLADLEDDVRWVMVGSPDPRVYPEELRRIEGNDYLSEILEALKNPRIASRVKFVGKTQRPASYIQQADVLIFWAAAPHFPRTVFEAWILKKPVLYFNPLYKNGIINSDNAYIIQNDTVPELVRSVRAIRSSQLTSDEAIQKSYELAKLNFTQRNFEKIKDVYQLCLAKDQSSKR